MSKLGGYLQRASNEAREHWLRAGYKLAIDLSGDADFWRPIVEQHGTMIVARQWFGGDEGWNAQAIADAVTRAADRLRPVGCNTVMGLNEVGHTGDGLRHLTQCEMGLIDIFHSRGLRYASGSFSVTWPHLDELTIYRPVLAATDYFCIHEYDAPSMRSHVGVAGYDDRVLYYRKLRSKMLDLGMGRLPPIIIGECGIDGGVIDGNLRGFRAFPETDYAADLAWYDGELARDDYVVGACVFGVGMNSDWQSFDVIGSNVQGRVEQYMLGAITPPPIAAETVRLLLPSGEIRTLELEEYLRDVIPNEMPALWPMEALRAQAVAARTFAVYTKAHPKHNGYDLDTTTGDQVWNPATRHANTDAAVKATAGETWRGNGQYCAECGLDKCPYCLGGPGSNGLHWPGRMCQYGAKILAEQGRDYKAILAFYYGGDVVVPPVEVPMAIQAFDYLGNPTTVEALQARYKFTIRMTDKVSTDGEVFRLVKIQEKRGPVSCVINIREKSDLAGTDLAHPRAAAWYWPEAPQRTKLQYDWFDRYDICYVGPNGDVGPGMGEGSFIHADGGPHKIWVLSPSTPSDIIEGIGWLETHDHVEPWFQLVDATTEFGTFDAADKAAVQVLVDKTPMSMKRLAERGYIWLNESITGPINHQWLYALGFAPLQKRFVALKIALGTWEVVAETLW